MATITETNQWASTVYMIEPTDDVQGDAPNTPNPSGAPNKVAKNLADRTLYLRSRLRRIGAGSYPRNSIIKAKYDTTTGVEAFLNQGSTIAHVALEASVAEPCILSFANGFDVENAVDRIVQLTADIELDMTGHNNANYALYAVYDAVNDTVSLEAEENFDADFGGMYNSEIDPNVYVVSLNTGSYWYNIIEGKVYRFNASGSPQWESREAVFLGNFVFNSGTAGSFQPNEFKSVFDLGTAIPAATVQAYAGSMSSFGARFGWLKCNGQAVDRRKYSRIFRAIGTTYGSGNGTTTFNLPDLRGEFIRGFDDGRGIDTGRVLGSAQADEFESHSHDIDVASIGGGGSTNVVVSGSGSGTTGATGGAETRPRNIAMHYLIKA